MKDLLNKKRERCTEEDSFYDSFILSNNKKPKNDENLIENKLDKYSNSTLESKNDFFLFETKKNEIFKIINCENKENKEEKNIFKNIELSFKNNKISLTKPKSFKKLRSISLNSNSDYKNTDSSFSGTEEYFPYH